MQQEELSDSVVITVSFIAIGPFFVDSAGGGSNNFFGNNVESTKLVALGLLRLVSHDLTYCRKIFILKF